MSDINEAFKAAGQIRAQQIRDERERRENPRKNTDNNAAAFAEHLEQQLNEQRASGMRLDTTNL